MMCKRYWFGILACAAGALLLAGCTTPTRNPGGYARIITPNLLAPPALEARIALEKDSRGEVANLDLRPVIGLGFGLVGIRLTLFPFDMAFGAFGYPFNYPAAEEAPPPHRATERRSERRQSQE